MFCLKVVSAQQPRTKGLTCCYARQGCIDRASGGLDVCSGTKHEVIVPEVDAPPLHMTCCQQVLTGGQLDPCHWGPQLHHLHPYPRKSLARATLICYGRHSVSACEPKGEIMPVCGGTHSPHVVTALTITWVTAVST